MTTTVVECTQLTKEYALPAETIHALRGVDFSVGEGEFIALMGPSGSGKSTLLHLLGTMDTATSGECRIAGQAVSTLNEEGRRKLRRDQIGFIFQEFHLVPTLTALENVMLPGLFGGAQVTRASATALLEAVGMSDRISHLPRELSGGQRQRVAIARALAHSPSLLLADEPTGNLDSETGLELMDLFRRLVTERQLTVVMVTHDALMAARADRIVTLRDGRVVG
jgi:putative ABC transport system ATP-binding protein